MVVREGCVDDAENESALNNVVDLTTSDVACATVAPPAVAASAAAAMVDDDDGAAGSGRDAWEWYESPAAAAAAEAVGGAWSSRLERLFAG